MIQPKRRFKSICLFFATLALAFVMSAQKMYAQYDDAYISYNDFYENLAPYGQWIDDPQYGYVWSPDQDGSFRPYYTNGHWVMTDYGNTWVSDYPWGWACFHYGRWTYDPYYGWLWIPGSNWGPAWVSWRYGDGYYGWAPLGPGYEFATYGDYACPNDWWVFIPPQYIYTGNYYRYWYGPRSNSGIIVNTVFVNNTYTNNNVTYVAGPRSKEIENITHQPVQVFKLTNSRGNLNDRVRNGTVKMYRPAEIRPVASINGQRVAPPNVVKAPQPVRQAQSVNSGQATPPQFRNNLPQQTQTPGTGFNRTAEPAKPQPRFDNNPYEWDVNRSVRQPQQEQRQQPEQQPQPQPQRNWGNQLPRQQGNQLPRQEPPRQMPQQPRRAPAPQQPRQAPQPQPQPRPAPAPAPQREGGRR